MPTSASTGAGLPQIIRPLQKGRAPKFGAAADLSRIGPIRAQGIPAIRRRLVPRQRGLNGRDEPRSYPKLLRIGVPRRAHL